MTTNMIDRIQKLEFELDVSMMTADLFDDTDAQLELLEQLMELKREIDLIEYADDVKTCFRVDPSSFYTRESVLDDFRKGHGLPFGNDGLMYRNCPDMVTTCPEDSFEFQAMSYEISYDKSGNNIVTIHGRTKDDKTVCTEVTGYRSACFVRIPGVGVEDAKKFLRTSIQQSLGYMYSMTDKCGRFGCKCPLPNGASNPRYTYDKPCGKTMSAAGKAGVVTRIDVIRGKSMLGFEPDESIMFRVEFRSAFMVKTFSNWIMKRRYNLDLVRDEAKHQFFCAVEVFEGDNTPIQRFMNDTSISGSSVVCVTAPKPGIRTGVRSDIHCSVDVKDISPVKTDDIFPIRILSWDIETTCVDDGSAFSNREVDSVIQISVHKGTSRDGTLQTDQAVVHMIGSAQSIVGGDALDKFGISGEVKCYTTEAQMILGFWQDLVEYSPDVITGYNDLTFDFPYLFARAQVLGLNFLRHFGRFWDVSSYNYTYVFESAQAGSLDMGGMITPGVIHFDLLQYFRRNVQLGGYSLDFVSKKFLNMNGKEDISYWEIPKYHKTEEGRTKLASYCLLDSILVLQIITKRFYIQEIVSTSRLLSVEFSELLSRGLGFKVYSFLRCFANTRGYYIPTFYNDYDTKNKHIPFYEKRGCQNWYNYKGAVVLPPSVGLHAREFVAVLDFKSLYPACQRYFNLSTDTYVVDEKHMKDAGLTPNDCYEIPIKDDDGNLMNTHYFVKEQRSKGVMALIQDIMADLRTAIKKKMKKHPEGSPMHSVFNAQQLGVKLLMNSLYGVCGSRTGVLPCVPVAEAITGSGRNFIIETRDWILSRYPGSECVYGDTDSVFMKFADCKTMESSMQRGQEIEGIINDNTKGGLFDPNKSMYLEMEKTYENLLLVSRKRYSGIKHEFDPKLNKVVGKHSTSGLQVIKRDTLGVVKDVWDVFLKKNVVELDKAGGLEGIRKIIGDLMMGTLPLERLCTSKKLQTWTPKVMNPQTRVALKKRSRGEAIGLGDRVTYFFANGSKRLKKYEIAEDLEYGEKNKMSGQLEHYLEAIKKSLTESINIVYSSEEVAKLFDITSYDRVERRDGPLSKFWGVSSVIRRKK